MSVPEPNRPSAPPRPRLAAESGRLRLLLLGAVPHGRELAASLGHEAVALELPLRPADAVDLVRRERPDAALVGAGEPALLTALVEEGACPVIIVLDRVDARLVGEAARHGAFAYVAGTHPDDWAGALEIALRRFSDFSDLEGAFGRRAVLERAKGILMERHGVDEAAAFALLRDFARTNNLRIVEVAEGVATSHRLLPAAS